MKVDNCSLHNNVKAQVNYKPPQREPDRRVCLHLKDVAYKNKYKIVLQMKKPEREETEDPPNTEHKNNKKSKTGVRRVFLVK